MIEIEKKSVAMLLMKTFFVENVTKSDEAF